MNKKIFILPLVIFATSSLSSCGGDVEPFHLTFKNAVDNIHVLNYETLKAKIEDKTLSESFVLFTYATDSPGCTCWLNIKSYVEFTYTPEHRTLFYCIGDGQLKNKPETFGITIPSSEPSICFFKNGTLVKQYDYGTHKSIFTPIAGEYKEFNSLMDRYTINDSKLYKYDTYEHARDSQAFKQGQSVFYTYKTSCPDCKKASTDVLFPFMNDNPTCKEVYMLDIDQYVGSLIYQDVKDELKLSTKYNETYGYDTGYVPTFQVWENGQIIDSEVFLNDEVNKNTNDTYYISNSYYSSERASDLKYTTAVLKDQEINANEVGQYYDEGEIKYYWKVEYAFIEHQGILLDFLNTYLI